MKREVLLDRAARDAALRASRRDDEQKALEASLRAWLERRAREHRRAVGAGVLIGLALWTAIAALFAAVW